MFEPFFHEFQTQIYKQNKANNESHWMTNSFVPSFFQVAQKFMEKSIKLSQKSMLTDSEFGFGRPNANDFDRRWVAGMRRQLDIPTVCFRTMCVIIFRGKFAQCRNHLIEARHKVSRMDCVFSLSTLFECSITMIWINNGLVVVYVSMIQIASALSVGWQNTGHRIDDWNAWWIYKKKQNTPRITFDPN